MLDDGRADAAWPASDAGSPSGGFDGSAPSATDGSVDTGTVDSTVPPLDAGQDAGVGTDGAAGIDSGRLDYDSCPIVDGNTVALFKAENPSSLIDETGAHTGTPTGDTVGTVAGAPMCGGQAYDYSGAGRAFFTVADSPDWNLTSGSVEFWVYLTDYTGDGILCRDAGGNGDGHLAIMTNIDGHIVARIEDTAFEYVRCSRDPLPLNTWHHVGINFGPDELRLFIDGVPGDRTNDVFGLDTGWTFNCTADGGAVNGLSGNANPWTVGSLCWRSTEGTNDTVGNTLSGYLDELRISDVQRPFN